MSLYVAVRALHLAAMAVWLSAGLLAPHDVHESLARGPDGVTALMGRLRRTARVMNAAASSTVASGLALVFLGRSWDTPARIWWGLGLTLLAVLVGRVLIRPAVGAIVAAQATLDTSSPADRWRLGRRFALAVRAEDALRLAVLALMVR